MEKQTSFEEAVNIDKKHHPVFVNQDVLLQIIDEYINTEKINLKYSSTSIIDGVGNIMVDYDGNPYVTLRLLLMSLRTHNNIVFFSKKYYAINTKIVETFNLVVAKNKYAKKMAFVEYDNTDEVLATNQSFFNLAIYIGDKREYIPFKKKLSIPSIYCGYGNVDVFVENKEFKDLLLEINKFARENNINISYYDDTSLEDTLKFVNKYELTDCFVLLSKDTEMIYKFISKIKCKNVYINKNPFDDYKFTITERDLTYKKNIIMN